MPKSKYVHADHWPTPPDPARISGVQAAVKAPLRILVVDDEPAIGAIVCNVFENDIVEAFERPADALLRAAEQPFDLILCDLMMPGMTGMEVHQALLRSVPELAARFILITGSMTELALEAFLSEHLVVLLKKPFRVAELEACVYDLARRP